MLGESVVNLGIGGERTSGGLKRIQSVIDTHTPTHLLILYGANDIINGVRPSDAAGRIADMADICRQSGVVPIIGTLTPFLGARSSLNGAARSLSSSIRANAASHDYFVADIEHAFGGASGLMQSDGTHPNNAGMTVIASTYFPLIGEPAPLAATPLTPLGAVAASRRPLFTWEPGEGATKHVVVILRDGAFYLSGESASESWQPPADLPAFNFTWLVLPWNASGYGPASSQLAFHYSGPDAGAPPAPSGMSVEKPGDGSLHYGWDGDLHATRYHIWVGYESGTTLRELWVETDRATGRVGFDIASHPLGRFVWWLSGESIDGNGPWAGAPLFANGLAVASAPLGAMAASPATLSWDDADCGQASSYHLWMSSGGKTIWDSWFARSATTPLDATHRAVNLPATLAFPKGSYSWWIQTLNSQGSGPVSATATFTLPLRIPLAPAPLAPTGELNDSRRPPFTWGASAHALWYNLLLTQGGRTVLDVWTQALNWTPSADLTPGDYRWKMRCWAPDGLSLWSSEAAFSIPAKLPGAMTQLAPTGTELTGTSFTYRWEADANTLWYNLLIQRNGATWQDLWYPAAAVATMTASVAGHPPGSSYFWRVRGWGNDGMGTWSAGMTFTTLTDKPAKPVLLVPQGSISESHPVFQWEANARTDWQGVIVNRGTQKVHEQWVAAPDTTLTSSVALPAGTYTWWLCAWNAASKATIWSDPMVFTITP
jgi:acyl-CoA thioesterase-1